jgi:hypothetical protein
MPGYGKWGPLNGRLDRPFLCYCSADVDDPPKPNALRVMRGPLGWLGLFWRQRRWLYAIYMLVAVARIPARTGFRLKTPMCDMRLTTKTIGLSLTKVPHMVLFGLFFLFTAVQFDRVDRRSLAWCLAATLILGALVELEEGATGTGNCRAADLLPDAVGALMAMVLLVGFAMIRSRISVSRANCSDM